MSGTNSYDSNQQNVCRHPCFNNYDFHNAIIHLPVASKYNVSSKYDRQGNLCFTAKTPENAVLSPYDAYERFLEAKKSIKNLTVAAIAGPGEALADFDAVRETLRLIRQASPATILCLSTNGLMLPVYANHLISLGVNYVTVTMPTIYPDTGAKIYDCVTYMGNHYYGIEGANILIQNQISGLHYLASRDVSVRINIEVIEDVNENEIEDIVMMAKECGCKMTNLLRKPSRTEDTDNGPETYSNDEISGLRRKCEAILNQSYFCKPCSPDTIETLNNRIPLTYKDYMDYLKKDNSVTEQARYRFAVCSKNGKLIDQHFGHATKFYIYDYFDGRVSFVETRPIDQYCQGSKEEKAAGRIYKLIKAIEDCNCIVCMRIGVCPSNALKEKRIDIYTTYNLIEDGLKEAVHRMYTGDG